MAKTPQRTRRNAAAEPIDNRNDSEILDVAALDREDPETKALNDFLKTCQGADSGATIRVHRMNETSGAFELDPRFRMSASNFDPFKISDIAGGGRYRVQLIGPGAKFMGQREISIAGAPKLDEPAPKPAATDGLGELRSMIADLAGQVKAITAAPALPRAESMDPRETIKFAFDMVQKVAPAVAPQPTAAAADPFEQFAKFESFRKSLLGKGGRRRDDDDDEGSEGMKLLNRFFEMIPAKRKPASSPQSRRANTQTHVGNELDSQVEKTDQAGQVAGGAELTDEDRDKQATAKILGVAEKLHRAGADAVAIAWAMHGVITAAEVDTSVLLNLPAKMLAEKFAEGSTYWNARVAPLAEVVEELQAIMDPAPADESEGGGA